MRPKWLDIILQEQQTGSQVMSRKKTLLVSKQQIWNNIIIYLELFDHRINQYIKYN